MQFIQEMVVAQVSPFTGSRSVSPTVSCLAQVFDLYQRQSDPNGGVWVDASGTDSDSELNDRIIQQACGLALQCDAELHMLYACDTSTDYLGDMGGGGLTLSNLTKQLRRELEKSFLALAGRYGVPSDRRHFILGQPVSALSEFANENQVDVIVMGRVQSHGLNKLVGSTTEHVLYQVPCSVLAV